MQPPSNAAITSSLDMKRLPLGWASQAATDVPAQLTDPGAPDVTVRVFVSAPCRHNSLMRSISEPSSIGSRWTRQRPGSLGMKAAIHMSEFFQYSRDDLVS